MDTYEFKLSQVSSDFLATARQIKDHLTQNNAEHHAESIQEIQAQIDLLDQERLLRIALIGQYNAGKSTIITALTGDRTIKIDSDIATGETTDYPWNGILVTDTPGLFTERHDHDEITYNAINTSDLLVFVITSDLFDDITVQNFIKLAYEDGYRHKLMLVVNKMSMEVGDFEQLVDNYTVSLNKALKPHSVRDFRTFFIDAADYLEGKEDNDTEMMEYSHFASFIEGLNHFVQRKGVMGKLDTPIRSVRSAVDKVLLGTLPSEDDKNFFMFLERMEKRVKRNQLDAENEVKSIVSGLRNKIIEQGNALCLQIGEISSDDWHSQSNKVNESLQRESEAADQELEQRLEHLKTELADEIKKLMDEPVGQHYWGRVYASARDTEATKQADGSSFRRNFEFLQDITSRASNKILSKAGSVGTSTTFAGPKALAGTELHQTVYSVGKFFGVKFRPWGAVNTAKGLTNVAKAAGPVLSIIGASLTAWEMWEDEKKRKELIDSRNQCSSVFIQIADDIENQFRNQFQEYQREFYQDVLDRIAARRNEVIQTKERKDAFSTQLREYRTRLDMLLKTLHQSGGEEAR